jgi:hypothetical protein
MKKYKKNNKALNLQFIIPNSLFDILSIEHCNLFVIWSL